jgi:hypothetical protein
MSNADPATTRARAQLQQQQQSTAWELEREQLLEQIQSLATRVSQLEESNNGGTAGQPTDGQPSYTQRSPVRALIKGLKQFSGVTGEKPSAKEWTAMVKATLQGCQEEEALAYLPSILKNNAYHWYELQVRKAAGPPWRTISDFCSTLTAHFTWGESLDETLDQWDKLAQLKNESVLHYTQRLETLKLQLELEGQELSVTQHYHKFRRNLRPELKQALLNHFGLDKYEAKEGADARQLLHQAITYLNSFEKLNPLGKDVASNSRSHTAPDLFSQRKAKGLCGNCGEGPWRPGHKCKGSRNQMSGPIPHKTNRSSFKQESLEQRAISQRKQVQMLVKSEEPEEQSETKRITMSVLDTVTQSAFVRGEINHHPVKVLVDTGSDYSFVAKARLEQLNLQPSKSAGETVEIAGGQSLTISECVKNVSVKLYTMKADLTKKITLRVMPMHQVDLLLGRDFVKNTLHIRSDLSITTEKGVSLLPWTAPMPQLESMLSVRQAKKCIRPSSRAQVYLVQGRVEDNTQNDGCTNHLEQDFLNKHAQIFSEHLPSFKENLLLPQHTIVLAQGTEAPCAKLRRFSPKEVEEISRQMQELLDKNFIAPSESPFGANVLLVKKSNGTWRMCVDYRALNRLTIKDKFPLPNLHDQLQYVQQAKYFSSLDLTQGYYQIPVKEKDRPKTAFRTADGIFQWNVMPFGLTNAPATFQRLVSQILKPYLRKFVLAYLDDILVFSTTLEEHKQHLEMVLKVLCQHRLTANPVKSKLFRRHLKYLGLELDGTGEKTTISPSSEITQLLDTWQAPTNIKELQRFLGFINYYRQFLQDCAGTSQPLLDLLRKNVPFVWSQAQQISFEKLKDQLKTLPELVTPEMTKPFHVYSDASDVAVGAVLEQNGKPILYASRTLNEAEQRYSTYDKELLAIYFALKQFKPYIWGANRELNSGFLTRNGVGHLSQMIYHHHNSVLA